MTRRNTEDNTRMDEGAAPDTPQKLAEACARVMWEDDGPSQRLGMNLDHVAPGKATLTMEVTGQMTNGHGTGHGGYIFALADSAFALACNTHNQRNVAQHCSITYIAPVSEGDRLTAIARQHVRAGRSAIYDVRVVNQYGQHVAEFRGHSRTVKGTNLPEGA
jgi:acyl-CoA thioesterase